MRLVVGGRIEGQTFKLHQGQELLLLKTYKYEQSKREKQKTKSVVELPIVNPYSAGIDIGDTIHVIAVAEGLSTERVRTLGTMTCDLNAIADWLTECEMDTVAMESTGVYWKPLFNLLCSRGFEVYLVNAAHAKNVTGRKDDENDAM